MKVLNDAFFGLNEMLLNNTGTNLAEVGLLEFFKQNPFYAVVCGVSLYVGIHIGGKFKSKKNVEVKDYAGIFFDKADAHFDNLMAELKKAKTQEEYNLALEKHSNWFSRLVWGLKKG